jgi:hypothetical protein
MPGFEAHRYHAAVARSWRSWTSTPASGAAAVPAARTRSGRSPRSWRHCRRGRVHGAAGAVLSARIGCGGAERADSLRALCASGARALAIYVFAVPCRRLQCVAYAKLSSPWHPDRDCRLSPWCQRPRGTPLLAGMRSRPRHGAARCPRMRRAQQGQRSLRAGSPRYGLLVTRAGAAGGAGYGHGPRASRERHADGARQLRDRAMAPAARRGPRIPANVASPARKWRMTNREVGAGCLLTGPVWQRYCLAH